MKQKCVLVLEEKLIDLKGKLFNCHHASDKEQLKKDISATQAEIEKTEKYVASQDLDITERWYGQ